MSSHLPTDAFPDLWPKLYAMKATGRIAHAYLLAGDDDEALQSVAREWGRIVACLTPEQGHPCGVCPPCLAFAANRYREWHELRPQSKSRQILVDDMRAFEHQLSLTATSGRRKLGVVIEADRLNDQAQNAFLKTLEEPPGDLVLMLLTTRPKALLPTIRSRCQLLSVRLNRQTFDVLAHVDIKPNLAAMKRDAGAATALASAAAFRQAFARLKQVAEADEPEQSEELDALAEQDAALKKRLQDQAAARVQAEYVRLRSQLCAVVESWFQQRYLLLNGVEPDALPNPEIAPDRDSLAGVDPLDAQRDALEAVKLSRFLRGNVDEALALDAFCLDVCRRG